MMEKPDWLKIRVQNHPNMNEVFALLNNLSLNTVCQEAQCPNIFECFSRKTATFLIMGKVCTRNCTFCDVTKGTPTPLDSSEPLRISQAVFEMNLKYVVITSVTRDDLKDGGAQHFKMVIEKIKEKNKNTIIEALIPDFKGNIFSLMTVCSAGAKVISHNIETIPRLYSYVRPLADYNRSLDVLKKVKEIDKSIYTKSGLMVGLGEKKDEVKKALYDLRNVGCEIVTIGQYLSPSKKHFPVYEYVHPDVFEEYKEYARKIGFMHVFSAPFVRSSYLAEEAIKNK